MPASSDRSFRDEDLELLALATLARGERGVGALVAALGRFGPLSPSVTDAAVGVLVRRLERDGLIVGQWQTDGRAAAVKRLRLTEAGTAALADRRAAWRRYTAAVDALLDPEMG